jgi:hypothetical protein
MEVREIGKHYSQQNPKRKTFINLAESILYLYKTTVNSQTPK